MRSRLPAWILALSVLSAGIALLLSLTEATAKNTLLRNGRWHSTKTDLGRPTLGAVSFLHETQALGFNRLALGSWHGYQELLTKESFVPREISFDLQLGWQSHLNVIYLASPNRRCAIRISCAENHPAAQIDAEINGAFTSLELLESSRDPLPAEWTHVRIVLDGEQSKIFLDSEEVASFRAHDTGGQASPIGFRSCSMPCFIDNVRVVSAEGAIFTESFRGSITTFLPLFLGGLAVLALLAWLLCRGSQGRTGVFRFVVVAFLLLLLSAGLLLLATVRGSRYKVVGNEVLVQDKMLRESTRQGVLEDARTKFPQPDQRAPGEIRLLLIGSSQTWGSGAWNKDWVLEDMIDDELAKASSGGTRIVTVNSAVPGETAATCFEYLKENNWLEEFKPDAALINLSHNDWDPEAFHSSMREMVGWLTENDVPVLLSKEANTDDYGENLALGERHAALDRVGEEFGAPVLDFHGHMLTHMEDGFLWWDGVHFTTFGQELAARWLAQQILELVPRTNP